MSIESLDEKSFFESHWQKKPLVLRGALPGISSLISPDELAGLSCEDGVESRIVMEKGAEKPWQVLHGPFKEELFSQLPKDHWTLLVQGVEQWLPEAYELLRRFNFIPNWRVDDLMVSYAPDGGSVGAHLDQYDVFLIQGWGKREWRIGKEAHRAEKLIPGLDLKILEEFTDYESVIMEEGDVLYLPPNFAHHGIALGDSMTFSVGFRAPHNKELLGHFCDHLLIHSEGELHYKDPHLRQQESPGELRKDHEDQLYQMAQDLLKDRIAFSKFIGQYTSQMKSDQKPEIAEEDPWDHLQDDDELELYAGARLLYSIRENKLNFFINGSHMDLEMSLLPLVKELSDKGPQFTWGSLSAIVDSPEASKFLRKLYQEGYLLEL